MWWQELFLFVADTLDMVSSVAYAELRTPHHGIPNDLQRLLGTQEVIYFNVLVFVLPAVQQLLLETWAKPSRHHYISHWLVPWMVSVNSRYYINLNRKCPKMVQCLLVVFKKPVSKHIISIWLTMVKTCDQSRSMASLSTVQNEVKAV